MSNYTTFTKKEKKAVITFSEEVIHNRKFNYRKLDKNFEIKRSNKGSSASSNRFSQNYAST